ncbi:MAG: bifunctional precorrin-2 dehydrogenase/sirohydrochlorin ferrochelatase [Clostridia bacterium]
MNFCPIFINMKDKKCIIVGGGRIAYRKIKTLLQYDAMIEVISPEVILEIEVLAADRIISIRKKIYEQGDLRGARLVFAATDQRTVNAAVAEEARQMDIFVNCIDAPQQSSFISPAVFQDGDLSIAVSTGGHFPKLARKIKQELKNRYQDKYAEVLKALDKLRQRALLEIYDEQVRKKIFDKAVEDDILDIALHKGITALEEKYNELFEEYCNEKKDNTGI